MTLTSVRVRTGEEHRLGRARTLDDSVRNLREPRCRLCTYLDLVDFAKFSIEALRGAVVQ